ncbi:MAG: hypothetical protein GF398_10265 [Chitinivibrionales bacterium]|nr:hypothetical protein [Chitinivibrionales bacterium]
MLIGMHLIGSTRANTFHDPQDDLSTIQFEYFFGTGHSADSLVADECFAAWWAYLGMPGIAIGKIGIFSALEVDGISRTYRYNGEALHTRPLNRIGLFGGATPIKFGSHRASVLIGSGIAGDFSDISGDYAYLHLIYDHRVRLHERLTIGLGILFQNNFGSWRRPANLLPYLHWKISPRAKLRIAWDNIEYKYFLTSRLSLSAEARYDLSFFRTRRAERIEFETVGLGGGADWWLGGNWYARVRYKEMVFQREIIQVQQGPDLEASGFGGRSVRILLVYGK